MARKSVVTITGINTTISGKLSDKGADSDFDKITEAYTRKIANESAAKAPVDTGLLRNTLVSGVRKSPGNDIAWEMVAGTDYTVRQEYEHSTNKAFIRRSVWDNEKAYLQAVERRAKNGGDG